MDPYPDPDSEPGTRRAKMTHKKNIRTSMFWSAGCSLLRAEGSCCNLDVLYGGLGIGLLHFWIQKKLNFFPAVVWSSLPMRVRTTCTRVTKTEQTEQTKAHSTMYCFVFMHSKRSKFWIRISIAIRPSHCGSGTGDFITESCKVGKKIQPFFITNCITVYLSPGINEGGSELQAT